MPSESVAEREDVERIFLSSTHEAIEKEKPPVGLKDKRVIVLAGPTACGKSAFAQMLAKMVGGEIVSADSMQVYEGLDIGTAKVTAKERREVAHHLIDIRHVTESFNVVDFCYHARRCCQEILARGNIPIVAGGSGFYLHAFLYGPPSGPPSVPSVRQALEREFNSLGADKMYERLTIMDPEYAKTITVHDKQKIVRALEIIELSGTKVSKLSWKERVNPSEFDFRCWFLHRPRSVLYQRIESRCEKMVDKGLVDEVKGLIGVGIRQNTSASQAIGYRHTLNFLETDQSRKELKAYLELFKRDSRRYAKRQLTWFRRERLFWWLDLDLHDPETAMDMIMQNYEIR